MALTDAVPIFHTADAAVSVAFYRHLGFEVDWEHRFAPDQPLFLALRCGAIRLFLSEHQADGARRGEIYLYTDDVDAVHATIFAAGWHFPHPRDQKWGCREFEATDPDGHRLRIGQLLAD